MNNISSTTYTICYKNKMLLFLSCEPPIKRWTTSELSPTHFIRQTAKQTQQGRFHSLFILNLRMYISAICVILCVFHIHSARAGVITEKLKLSQVSAAQNDGCPPGVWTCQANRKTIKDWQSILGKPDTTLLIIDIVIPRENRG